MTECIHGYNGRTWDGGWENSQGQNIFPYKGDERVINDPMDYTSHEINEEVA